MKPFIYGLIFVLMTTGACHAREDRDLLQAALDSIGFSRADLGIDAESGFIPELKIFDRSE